MAEDEVALQLGGITGIDLETCELAESGIDPVDGLIAQRRRRNPGRGPFNRRFAGTIQHNRALVPVKPGKLIKGDLAGDKVKFRQIRTFS